MTLYRIEHREQCVGPFEYADDDDTNPLRPWRLDAYRMPAPADAGLNDLGWAETRTRFACDSLGRLLRWFTPADRAVLAPKGFVVAKYYCPPHRCRQATDRSQVAFDYGAALRLGWRPIRGAAR